MAVDTRNKRASVLGFAVASLLVLPAPDATIDQADRSHVAYSYASAAEAPLVPPNFIFFTDESYSASTFSAEGYSAPSASAQSYTVTESIVDGESYSEPSVTEEAYLQSSVTDELYTPDEGE